MSEGILSVFVDESGKMQHPDPMSRYYVVGMVFHRQNEPIDEAISSLDASIKSIGFDPERFVFHAGPIVRAEKNFSMMSRNFRGRIFLRMMGFAMRVPFKYHCFCVDKKYIDSVDQIVESLKREVLDFIREHNAELANLESLKLYYDCGQAPITNLLHETFKDAPCRVEFVQGVRPERYKLFQLADLICTIYLVERKLQDGEPMSNSEYAFFGGRRPFKHNVLRYLKPKEI